MARHTFSGQLTVDGYQQVKRVFSLCQLKSADRVAARIKIFNKKIYNRGHGPWSEEGYTRAGAETGILEGGVGIFKLTTTKNLRGQGPQNGRPV